MPTESQEMENQTTVTHNISDAYEDHPGADSRPSVRLFVALAAATSALLGGLAAAWYYKRTLSRLQEAEFNGPDSKIGIPNPVDDEGL